MVSVTRRAGPSVAARPPVGVGRPEAHALRPGAVRLRAGFSLIEMLVALPLVALVLAMATALFLTQLRGALQSEARLEATRTLTLATQVLAHDLRAIAPPDLIAWSDTTVELDVAIAAGVSCGAPAADIVDVLMTDAMHGARWRATPAAGDRVVWADADGSLLGDAGTDSLRAMRHLDAYARTPGACAGSVLRGAEPPVRLMLSSGGAAAVPPPGVLVLVLRRIEWRAYQASDGEVWLGRRERRGGTWSVIQPVVGPLAGPVARGLTLAVLRRDGGPATPARHDAAWVQLQLRAQRRPAPGGHASRTDSLAFRLALRGGD